MLDTGGHITEEDQAVALVREHPAEVVQEWAGVPHLARDFDRPIGVDKDLAAAGNEGARGMLRAEARRVGTWSPIGLRLCESLPRVARGLFVGVVHREGVAPKVDAELVRLEEHAPGHQNPMDITDVDAPFEYV
jgi:hypothetical protein